VDVEVTNAQGGTDLWSIEMASQAQLRRRGWTPTSLKPGDKVTAVLHPRRDGVKAGNAAVPMTFQHQRLLRFIYLNQMYPHNSDLSFHGEAHGQWDGKALRVTTSKFKDGTLLDGTGIPHGAQLQISERYELTSPDTLTNRVTITDPEYFSQPWQTDIVLKKQAGVQIQEDVCVERQGIHK
jgi:hypothetical protein